MKIVSIRAHRKQLALKKPYTITRQTISDAEIVFFEVELANGDVGLGSANTDTDVVAEDSLQTLANLQSETVAELIGKDIREFRSLIIATNKKFSSFPGTMAAIDIALHDAFGKYLGISILDFYGRAHRKMITSVTIGIKGLEDTLAEAEEYYKQGFKALKVKTGLDAEEDAERIIMLRAKYEDHFAIRVDANTGYSAAQLEQFIKLTQYADVELIEQPLLPGTEQELLDFPLDTRNRLAADESLKGASSALALVQERPFGIYNIKLMKCGGILPALDIATIAREADISLFWGCNDESMVSITAALHVAFACPHTRYIDLDGSLDLAEDMVIDGFVLQDGYMMPNNKPGLGLTWL